MRKTPLSARAALALPAALLALALPADAESFAIDAETFTLPNGMTVVLYEDHSLPKVAVNTWFHVGSKDERTGRTGFAHLFEHLMFMGTKRAPDNQYDLLLEGGGAWSNASTSSDRTNYYSVGPSELLPTMLWLEADRLDGLADAMSQQKLDAQRDVVRNERRERENAPYGRADMLLTGMMFPVGHPYHHPVIGSHEDLAAATVDDVTDFFRTYYVPGNATVVVAGDFDRAAVRPLVEKTFGALPATSTPEHKTAPPPVMTAEVRAVETDKVEFPRITLAWHSPAYFRDGDGQMDLVAGVLAGGSASRLEKRLVLQDEIAQSVVAYQSSDELSSLFLVEATAAPGADLETIKGAILEELATLAKEGPTEGELIRVKAQLEASFLRRMENLPSRADRINTYRHYYGTTDGFQADLDRWANPGREDVRAWAETVFSPGRLDLRVFPETEEGTQVALDERPENFGPGDFTPPLAETFKLSNGIEVYTISRPGTRLFTGRMMATGGENHVPADQAGLSNLTGAVLNSGAGGKNASEFADAVESLGASLWVAAGRTVTTVGVSGISSRLGEALDLFADVVLRPNLSAEDFEREKSLALAAIRSRGDDAGALSRIVGAALLFAEEDPRHRPFTGTEETVTALTLDDVRAQVNGTFRPEQARFTFAGDFNSEVLREELERRFRKWKTQGEATTGPGVTLRDGPGRFVLVNRADAPQTVIYATRMVPRLEGPDRAARGAANTIFGGSFTSRLNANLREENGFTYGAFGRLVDTADYTYMFITSDVFTDVTAKALTEMIGECNGMAEVPPTEEEIGKAIETGRTNLVDTAQTTERVGTTLVNLVLNGRPLDSVARDLAALRSVSPGDVRGVAAGGLWDWSGLNVVLVGDQAAVLAQLEEAGLPAPELVDELGRPLMAEGAGTR